MPSYWPQLLRIKGYSYRKQICISAPPLVSPELGVISAEARGRILESHDAMSLILVARIISITLWSYEQITFATHNTNQAAWLEMIRMLHPPWTVIITSWVQCTSVPRYGVIQGEALWLSAAAITWAKQQPNNISSSQLLLLVSFVSWLRSRVSITQSKQLWNCGILIHQNMMEN